MTDKKRIAAGIVVACIVVAVFLPNVTAFFHSDDLDHLWFVSRGGPFGVWRYAHQDYFRPLFSMNMWLEWHLWGRKPLGYHICHCLMHAANTLLLFLLGRRLQFSPAASGTAALLFLVLPGHSEAVAWIGDRAGLLTTLFTLLALHSFFPARSGSPRASAAFILCCVLALLSKEAAILMPVFVAAFNAMRPGGSVSEERRGRLWALGLCLLFPLYFLARWLYVGSLLGGPSGTPHIPMLYVLWGLLRALPAALCPMTTSTPMFLLASAVLLLACVWLFLRSDAVARRDVFWLLVAFYAAALPVSWVSRSPPLWGYDTRVLYLPSVFACLALARLLESIRLFRPIAAALFLIFSAQSYLIFQQWNLAGEWVRNGLATMAAFPPCQRRIVLVSPDLRYPAYVFRRGMESGLQLIQNDPHKKIMPLALTVFYTEQDRVDITPEGDGVSVVVHYAKRSLKRTPVIEATTGAPWPLKTENPPTFHLTLPSPQPGDQIVYFSEGTFHLWPGKATP